MTEDIKVELADYELCQFFAELALREAGYTLYDLGQIKRCYTGEKRDLESKKMLLTFIRSLLHDLLENYDRLFNKHIAGDQCLHSLQELDYAVLKLLFEVEEDVKLLPREGNDSA